MREEQATANAKGKMQKQRQNAGISPLRVRKGRERSGRDDGGLGDGAGGRGEFVRAK
jgi:hypothetical protein